MEYNIQHLHLIKPANQQPFFEEEVQKKLKRLKKMLNHYPKELVLEIFVRGEGDDEYIITASLNMKSKEIVVKERGRKAVIVVNNVLDRLISLVREQVHVERREYLQKRQYRLRQVAEKLLPGLRHDAKKPESSAFANLINTTLPELKRYIKNRVGKKPALLQLIKKNVLSIRDIVDEVVAALYAEFSNNTEATDKWALSFYFLADQEIDKLNEKYKKEFRSQVSTEQLTKQEMKDMQEDLTANADFIPILTEELDEQFYNAPNYDLKEILIDAGAEQEILNLAEADDADIGQLVRELPEEQEAVMKMYYIYRMDIPEIAQAKQTSESKVLKWLKDAREELLHSLKQHAWPSH
ncbi:MAG TPA: sigma-70 region 4 domain-containing protein [Puia sp.]|nr:sigma-70 region 4 domain-containing protein [Puia sp.]